MSPSEIRRNWKPNQIQNKILQEIAAQLAELNAKLADVGSPIAVALCRSNDVIPVLLTTL